MITNPKGKQRALTDFSVSEYLQNSRPSVQRPSVKVTNTKPKPKPNNAGNDIYTRAGGI